MSRRVRSPYLDEQGDPLWAEIGKALRDNAVMTVLMLVGLIAAFGLAEVFTHGAGA